MKTITDTEMKTTTTTGELPSHVDLREQVDEYVDATQDSRALGERCRDYRDGRQWTADQIADLKKRKQAPVVNNRIKVKQNGLLGIMSLRKAEPKAYPRNQVDSDTGAAEVCTDGLNYAADRIRFNSLMNSVADNYFCEGTCGTHITVEQLASGEIEVVVEKIHWDRIFYDPYSREADFSDARYKGFMLWMDEDDIRAKFPDAPDDVFSLHDENNEDFEDKPEWFRSQRRRRRYLVATHYFLHQEVWHVAIYTGSGYLMEPEVSPYVDEDGQPVCPIELEHAYIDRENGRYGELASFLDLQDEINHRRSKALFLLSQRQTFGNRGAVKDVKKAKRELAKADGHLEIGTGELNKDFGILPTNDMAAGQMELYNDAKAEMDAQSFSAQLAGDRQMGDLSGVAIRRLQSAGIVELNLLFDQFSDFKLRNYKQMWWRMRQFWDKEKWIRVTDDEDNLRWIGFNVPVTMGQALQDIMDDENNPREMRLGASAQMIQLEQMSPESLEEVIEVQNEPAKLDMDLVLEETFDFINASEEQLDAILKFGAQAEFDIIDLLEISNIRHKEKLIERIENRRTKAAEAAAQQPPDPQATYLEAKAGEAQAAAQQKIADAQHQQVETQILVNQPMLPYKTTVGI